MMSWEENTTQAIENLLIYASAKGLIETVDMPYFRNLLLDAFQLDAPAGDIVPMTDVPPTATALLRALCDLAVEKGIIEDMTYVRDLFSARLMGLLTPSPKEVRAHFQQCVAQNHPEQATEDFYQMCRACDYIKVDAIAQNVRYFADTPAGRLEITINLSKPEKDPKEIAKRPASAIRSVCCAWRIPATAVAATSRRGRTTAWCRCRSLGRRGICSIRRMRITRSTASC